MLAGIAPFVDALLIRHKTVPPHLLWAEAKKVQQAVPGIPLWINGPLEVALSIGAAGWHLPADQIPAGILRTHWSGILSASAHTAEEVRWHHGADVFLWGHAFETRSKPGLLPRQGLEDVVARAGRRVLALGGITPQSVTQLGGLGLGGVVVADGVWMEPDPIGAAARIRQVLGTPSWSS